MDAIIERLPQWVHDIPLYLTTLVVIATALVSLPFLTKYEEAVNKVVDVINEVLDCLPTLGKNPQTKKLEAKKD